MANSFRIRSRVASTYRLQFHRGFKLRDALEIVPYLAELGVSHIYASPLLAARCGSLHGYDLCDPTRINPEIGSEEDLAGLAAALRERGMGLVLDIVPNHMSASEENPWWWDVLKLGQASRFASYFDIDWEALEPRWRGKVILPILGDELESVLSRGELRIESGPRGFVMRYFEHRLPLSAESIKALGPRPESALLELNASPESVGYFLGRQHYRLVFWRLGNQALNYRRFFNISELAAVRVEVPQVFADTHSRVLQWYRAGLVEGLRIDHPDGLYDPEQYLKELRKNAAEAWLVIEKILAEQEALPAHWPIQGTSGYDFLNRLAGLFIQPKSERTLTQFYAEFTHERRDFADVAHDKKRLALHDLFGAEIGRLLCLLDGLLTDQGLARVFSKAQAKEALIELAASFTVYRTYVRAEAGPPGRTDLHYLDEAAARAQQNRPELSALVDFLRDVLSLKKQGRGSSEFVMRFQQLTGPVMAKGVEDTAFYCFNRFVALNEVGGNPGVFGITAGAFHDTCRTALRKWPFSMLATSTHDTKRSEDVRARLALLSEMPESWISAVRRWSGLLEKYRPNGLPDRNAEYLLYQTLVGAWPLPPERAWAYMQKAAREAKEHTSWSEPDSAYEGALEDFLRRALEDREFTTDLEQFVTPLIEPGQVNSLAQTLLKLTAPGVPDIYQGTELWDLSLVDPDNRRPVNFALRRGLLNVLKGLTAEGVWERRVEGLPKLWLVWRTLSFRSQRRELFGQAGAYDPLYAEGERADNVVAFMRGGDAVIVVPRLVLGLKDGWANTGLVLPIGLWQNELTSAVIRGGKIPVHELLADFPVTLLSRRND